MKNKKYLIIISALILMLIIYLILTNTLSKFAKTVSGTASGQTARLVVNVSSLKNGEARDFETELEFVPERKSIVAENKIAPGINAVGSFMIDTTGSNVGAKYRITFENPDFNDLDVSNVDIIGVTASYTKNSEEITSNLDLINTSDGKVCSGEILLADVNCPLTITATMAWNFTDNIENDLGITAQNVSTNKMIVPVKVSVVQAD